MFTPVVGTGISPTPTTVGTSAVGSITTGVHPEAREEIPATSPATPAATCTRAHEPLSAVVIEAILPARLYPIVTEDPSEATSPVRRPTAS